MLFRSGVFESAKINFYQNLCVQDEMKCFFANNDNSVLMFVFRCFSYLEETGYDLLRVVETGDVKMVGQLLSLSVSSDIRSW